MNDFSTEHHPFKAFIPKGIKYLILGSFPGQNTDLDWYYGAKRNQFWDIISTVYSTELKTIEDKKHLFEKLGIGLTDVLLEVRRTNNSNLDNNLECVAYNFEVIQSILNSHKNIKVFATSKFVENKILKLFPRYNNIEYLPSPSPRNARMNKVLKIEIYKSKLPVLPHTPVLQI